MSGAAVNYLRKREWSMGNGQCPECCAQGPSWLGFGGWGNEIGHRAGCPLAHSLTELGQTVVWQTQYARVDGMFSAVNWEHADTKALVAVIEQVHPHVLAQGFHDHKS